MKLIKYWCR